MMADSAEVESLSGEALAIEAVLNGVLVELRAIDKRTERAVKRGLSRAVATLEGLRVSRRAPEAHVIVAHRIVAALQSGNI